MTQSIQIGQLAESPERLRGGAIAVLAVAAAVATSTSYVLQPELPAVARDVDASLSTIKVVAALPIAGYLLGLALLVPLADRVRSNRLIAAQLTVLAAGLCLAAVAATPFVLGMALLPVLLLALALFDAGLFSAQVANQSSVLGIDSARPAQFNSAYMVVYFVGGSAGTAIGGSLIYLAGWPGVTIVATCALLAAACIVLDDKCVAECRLRGNWRRLVALPQRALRTVCLPPRKRPGGALRPRRA